MKIYRKPAENLGKREKQGEERVLCGEINLPVADPVLDSTTTSKGETDGGNKSNLQSRRKHKLSKIRAKEEKGCNKHKRISFP